MVRRIPRAGRHGPTLHAPGDAGGRSIGPRFSSDQISPRGASLQCTAYTRKPPCAAPNLIAPHFFHEAKSRNISAPFLAKARQSPRTTTPPAERGGTRPPRTSAAVWLLEDSPQRVDQRIGVVQPLVGRGNVLAEPEERGDGQPRGMNRVLDGVNHVAGNLAILADECEIGRAPRDHVRPVALGSRHELARGVRQHAGNAVRGREQRRDVVLEAKPRAIADVQRRSRSGPSSDLLRRKSPSRSRSTIYRTIAQPKG